MEINKINIDDKFPKDILIQIMKPYLYLHIISRNHISGTEMKENCRSLLRRMLNKFYHYNPNFGKKKYIRETHFQKLLFPSTEIKSFATSSNNAFQFLPSLPSEGESKSLESGNVINNNSINSSNMDPLKFSYKIEFNTLHLPFTMNDIKKIKYNYNNFDFARRRNAPTNNFQQQMIPPEVPIFSHNTWSFNNMNSSIYVPINLIDYDEDEETDMDEYEYNNDEESDID